MQFSFYQNILSSLFWPLTLFSQLWQSVLTKTKIQKANHNVTPEWQLKPLFRRHPCWRWLRQTVPAILPGRVARVQREVLPVGDWWKEELDGGWRVLQKRRRSLGIGDKPRGAQVHLRGSRKEEDQSVDRGNGSRKWGDLEVVRLQPLWLGGLDRRT